MGCGTSKAVQAIEEDLNKSPIKSAALLDVPEDLTSVRSNTPDVDSKTINPPILHSNGTEPSAPPINTAIGDSNTPDQQLPPALQTPPHSGGRAVAFEVGPADPNESLIRRHPPKKFQKLEDQQAPSLTQEQLNEKQATAEKRRQEILTQRVQSAKHRSAGRMRSHATDANEVEQLDDGEIESAETDRTDNEL